MSQECEVQLHTHTDFYSKREYILIFETRCHMYTVWGYILVIFLMATVSYTPVKTEKSQTFNVYISIGYPR